MSPPSKIPQNTNRFLTRLPPALQYPAYRSYWLSMVASVSGFQIFQFTLGWLIFHVTDSSLWLGYTLLAIALPGILFNPFGGVFADRVDKRRVIIVAQSITAALLFLLATLTLLGELSRWHVIGIAFLVGGVDAFNIPARMALYPRLIDRKVMVSAVALNSSIWQGTRIVAPAVAGIIIGFSADLTGAAAAFYLSGTGFLVMAAVIFSLKLPPITDNARGNAGRNLLEGFNFIRRSPIFSFLIGMTFFNSFFAISYVLLLPVFAERVLAVGAEGLGVLAGTGGVGALLTNLWLGTRRNSQYRGLLIIGGGVSLGIFLILFGVTSHYIGSFSLALALVFSIGVCNTLYMNSVQSTLQMLVPNQMRGRVMGFYAMTWSIMPLGGLFLGWLTHLVNAPFAVAVGGAAVATFALGPALLNPRIRQVGRELQRVETASAPAAPDRQPAPTPD